MSATQATVTSTQVAVRYRRNVGSLSIYMSTDTRPIYDRDVSVNIATDISADMSVDMSTDTSRTTHRLRVGRYVDRHISNDTSAESWSICRPTYWSSIGRYVDRQSTEMSVDMSTNISVEVGR